MSLSILEQLEKRTKPKKMKKVELILDKGQVAIESAKIQDKTQQAKVNIRDFRKKIKQAREPIKKPVLTALPSTIGESSATLGKSVLESQAPSVEASDMSKTLAPKTIDSTLQQTAIASAAAALDSTVAAVTTPPEKIKSKMKLPGTKKKFKLKNQELDEKKK